MLISGGLHLLYWALSDLPWEGPLSPRKPALFGLSTGATLASLAWIYSVVIRRQRDPLFLDIAAWGLLCEVALIALQFWRGVPSHFNHQTPLDTGIELAMLLCVAWATLVIIDLTWRAFRPLDLPESTACGVRWGLVLLLISCGLGVLAQVWGAWQLHLGRAPEYWGVQGVLKFPHGAAIHAVQLLPAVAAIANQFAPRSALRCVQLTGLSQLIFLCFALRQTLLDRPRFELDAAGNVLLACTGLALSAAVLLALQESLIRPAAPANWQNRPT
jgi:hypothetical protein